MHLGNVFSFLLTAKLAKQQQAGILLRIDDLDALRAEEKYYANILEVLIQLGIEWTLGPKTLLEIPEHSQQSRMSIYSDYLKLLIERDLVYVCTCSRSDIEKRTGDTQYDGHCRNKQHVFVSGTSSYRLRTNPNLKYQLLNEVGKSKKTNLPDTMTDFIVWRKDNIPAYQLASLCDDIYFGIDFVVRGLDLMDSTLAQLFLAEVLELHAFKNIHFLHHELLVNAAGHKLSKSAGAAAVSTLLQDGPTKLIKQLEQQAPGAWRHLFKHASI